MINNVLKDIRYYESKPQNYIGAFDGVLGNVFKNTDETKFIGQRIVRKLNEFGFVAGEFDHLYICFSSTLMDNEIIESEKFIDKRIKTIDYGIKPDCFNSLSQLQKNIKVKELTFEVFNFLYKNEIEKSKKILNIEKLINQYGSEIEIGFITKETESYKIEINYQIKPNGSNSVIIMNVLDKKNNKIFKNKFDLDSHEDIYYMIDSITIKDEVVTFNPKKTNLSQLVNQKYKLPIKFEINKRNL